MLERTGAITNGILEPISFALAYPTLPISPGPSPLLITSWPAQEQLHFCIAYVLLHILSETVSILACIVE